MFLIMTTQVSTDIPQGPPENQTPWSQRTDLYNAIIERIRVAGDVTVHEIETIFKIAKVPADGDLGISVGPAGQHDMPNVYIWVGVSTEFHDIFDQLFCDYRLKVELCDPTTYMFEGSRGPGLPALDITRPLTGQKKPHWLPVVISWHVNKDGVRLPD